MAVAFTAPRESLSVIERAEEPLTPGDVRVRVEACGLGLGDFGFFQLDHLPRTPLIPGVEAVGLVEAVGEGVTLELGARVGLTPLASACGGCGVCERGLERWCERVQLHGWHRDGFLAAHAVLPAHRTVPLNAGDDPTRMAPVFASGWTAMAAVRATRVGVGARLGVLGVGGLGHLVVQLARAQGCEVAISDVDPQRAALGVALGAVEGLPSASVEAVVLCTPSAQALHHAARAVKRGGVIVLAAASPGSRFDLPLFDVVMRGVALEPAFLGSRSELDELMALVRQGRVSPRVTTVPVREVPSRFWWLRDGGFEGRLVATFP